MKKISLVLLTLIMSLCFCSCQKENTVIVDDLLSIFKEDNTFSFYYKSKISGLKEGDTYKVYYLSYDLNADGIDEDLTYYTANGNTSKIQLDIFDVTTGRNIAPRGSFNLKDVKIQILKTKTEGYNNLVYVTCNEKHIPVKSEEMYFSDGYYTEK